MILVFAMLAGSGFSEQLPEWYSRPLPDVEFQARMVNDAAEIERVVGDPLDGDFILIELKAKPLYGTKLQLDRGDFLMRSRRNNDTSEAQSPARIAGDAVLALGVSSDSSTIVQGNQTGQVYGGAPGTGTNPRRLDNTMSGLGGGSSSGTAVHVSQQQSSGETTLAGRLAQMELPLEAYDEVVSGYLYFQIPSKVKRKYLELSYEGALGEFLIEFKKAD